MKDMESLKGEMSPLLSYPRAVFDMTFKLNMSLKTLTIVTQKFMLIRVED